MDPYALAISSHIIAKDKFLDLASFRAAQTIEMCSQHPGTFSIQHFCTDKKSLPSTFSKAIGQNWDVMCSCRINFWDINFLGTPPLMWYYALVHTRKKELKNKLIYFWALFVDLIEYSIRPWSWWISLFRQYLIF